MAKFVASFETEKRAYETGYELSEQNGKIYTVKQEGNRYALYDITNDARIRRRLNA